MIPRARVVSCVWLVLVSGEGALPLCGVINKKGSPRLNSPNVLNYSCVRFRCNLASLLTIALHGKLEYYTSIMKELLVDLIDASASKNPKLMLRRTESVVEKMLTNWMSICMYSYLKVCEELSSWWYCLASVHRLYERVVKLLFLSHPQETVGEQFFLLLCAIKQQINKGSIDAITGKARYTLNEEWLLRANIEAKPQVSFNTHNWPLGLARYPFFRTDTKNPEYLPIPISIRYLGSFFLISVEFLYFNVCWPDHDFLCVTHNLLNIDNFIVKTTNECIYNYNLWQKYYYKLG